MIACRRECKGVVMSLVIAPIINLNVITATRINVQMVAVLIIIAVTHRIAARQWESSVGLSFAASAP